VRQALQGSAAKNPVKNALRCAALPALQATEDKVSGSVPGCGGSRP
jgi:hypothetical protein